MWPSDGASPITKVPKGPEALQGRKSLVDLRPRKGPEIIMVLRFFSNTGP